MNRTLEKNVGKPTPEAFLSAKPNDSDARDVRQKDGTLCMLVTETGRCWC